MIWVLLAQVAWAGGWTQPAGDTYIKVWDRSLIGAEGFFADGSRRDLDTVYQDHALNAYAEWGAAEAWTVTLSTNPLGYAAAGGGKTAYVGPSWLGLRRGLTTESPWRTAIELRAGGAPGVGARVGSGQVEGDPWEYRPTVGTAQLGGELQAGRSLWRRTWASAAVGGWWFSRAEMDPVVTATLQWGVSTTDGWAFALTVPAWLPTGPVQHVNVAGAGQTRYLGFGGDLSRKIAGRLAVTVGIAGAAAWSNASTPSLLAGIEL